MGRRRERVGLGGGGSRRVKLQLWDAPPPASGESAQGEEGAHVTAEGETEEQGRGTAGPLSGKPSHSPGGAAMLSPLSSEGGDTATFSPFLLRRRTSSFSKKRQRGLHSGLQPHSPRLAATRCPGWSDLVQRPLLSAPAPADLQRERTPGGNGPRGESLTAETMPAIARGQRSPGRGVQPRMLSSIQSPGASTWGSGPSLLPAQLCLPVYWGAPCARVRRSCASMRPALPGAAARHGLQTLKGATLGRAPSIPGMAAVGATCKAAGDVRGPRSDAQRDNRAHTATAGPAWEHQRILSPGTWEHQRILSPGTPTVSGSKVICQAAGLLQGFQSGRRGPGAKGQRVRILLPCLWGLR